MSISRETYDIASQAIGAELLSPAYNPEKLAELTSDEAVGLFPIQSDIYVTALQGVARYMRRNQALSSEPLSRNDRLPTDSQYSALQDELQPARHRLHMISGVAKLIEREDSGSDQILRPSQRTLFGGLSDFLAKRSADPKNPYHRKGYVKSTTGSGKNFVIAKFAEAIKDEAPAMPKVLILVPGKSDIKQVLGRPKRNGFAEHAPSVKATEWSSDVKDLSGDVVVATYAGFVRGYENGIFKSEDYGAVLCDEVHKAIGSKTQESIEDFSKNMVNIGFTATDAYSENHCVSNHYDELIYSMTLRESVERGEVPPIQTLLFQTNTDITGEFTRTKDFSQQEFDKLISDEARNKQADDIAVSMVERGEAILVACTPGNKAQHAKERAQALSSRHIIDPSTGKKRNIVAVAVHGDMPTEDRENAYERYEKGKIDVLTFVNVLNESFDSDRASVLINLRPTTSPVIAEQRLGRIVRGTRLATVVDFIDKSRRNQCLVLHVLGENRYVMGRVYGRQQGAIETADEDKSQTQTFALPAHILKGFKKLSGRHLGTIIKDKKVDTIEYQKLSLSEAAIATDLNPLIIAIIGKELGVVEYTDLQPNQKKPQKPIISEEHLAAIESAFASERYEVLRHKSPEDLMRILEILHGSHAAFNSNAYIEALDSYSSHMGAIRASRDVVNMLREATNGKLATSPNIDRARKAALSGLINVSKHMDPSDEMHVPYQTFLRHTLEATSADVLRQLLKQYGIHAKTDKSEAVRRDDGSYSLTVNAKVNEKPLIVERSSSLRAVLPSQVYAELIMHSLSENQGVAFMESGSAPEAADTQKLESVTSEDITKLFLESGFIGMTAIKNNDLLLHGSGSNAIHESASKLLFRVGSRQGEQIVITGVGSTSTLARQDKWDKIANELTKNYGDLTAHFLMAAFGNQNFAPEPKPQQPKLVKSESITNDAKLIKFMGTNKPETYLSQLSAANGLRPPKINMGTRGDQIVVDVKVFSADTSKGFVIGHAASKDQKQATKTALMSAVRLLKKISDGEIDSDSPQAKKLRELGYIL